MDSFFPFFSNYYYFLCYPHLVFLCEALLMASSGEFVNSGVCWGVCALIHLCTLMCNFWGGRALETSNNQHFSCWQKLQEAKENIVE